jgi:glycosyltransferase involved in cell wall biosynthesis
MCFQRSGAANEYIQKDCGFIVPYLDVNRMGDKVLNLQKDPFTLNKLRKCTSAKIQVNNSLVKSTARILDIIGCFI